MSSRPLVSTKFYGNLVPTSKNSQQPGVQETQHNSSIPGHRDGRGSTINSGIPRKAKRGENREIGKRACEPLEGLSGSRNPTEQGRPNKILQAGSSYTKSPAENDSPEGGGGLCETVESLEPTQASQPSQGKGKEKEIFSFQQGLPGQKHLEDSHGSGNGHERMLLGSQESQEINLLSSKFEDIDKCFLLLNSNQNKLLDYFKTCSQRILKEIKTSMEISKNISDKDTAGMENQLSVGI